jgi:hypothetical protein
MTLSQSVRNLAVVAAIASGAGIAGVGLAGPASAGVLLDQPLGVGQCQPNTSQRCPQEPEVNFTVPGGAGTVQASFTADAGHCSDINVRLIKDNPDTGWYPFGDWQRVGPGQTVSVKTDMPAGPHAIKVQAEGIEGGCNVGHLDAWGGNIRVEADAIPTEAPKPGSPFQIPPFGPGGLFGN